MSSLAEIEQAVTHLPPDQKERFLDWALRQRNIVSKGKKAHSVADIPTISLGKVIRPLESDDDLLGEMLEDRA